LEAGAGGGSGTSVERFAAASVAGGVSVGCAGGGWRPITGLREPHPEKQTQRTQKAQRTQRKKEAERNDCRLPRSPKKKAVFAGRDCAGIGSVKILKGGPAS